MEHRPAGDRCGKVQMNVDIMGSRRNRPQLSTRHDDDYNCHSYYDLLSN